MIDAFVFDIDGTLADTFPLIVRAFNEFAVKYLGEPWTIEELVAQFGPPESEIIGNRVEPELREEAIEYYYRAYEDMHDGTSLFDGISEVILDLEKRGKKLSIFTGKGRRSTDITLGKLEIENRFAPVVTGDDVTNGKPHPEGLFKVMDDIGIPAGRVAMVGDHGGDIISGHKAGVYTIAALWHGYDNDALMRAEPHVAFEQPRDLLEWVRNEIPEKITW